MTDHPPSAPKTAGWRDHPSSAGWRDHPRYPDPLIETLDPRFEPYRIFSAAVERLHTGSRWAEGPVWFGDGRYLLWSDIPNNRILKWEEETGAVSVFRKPTDFANGMVKKYDLQITTDHFIESFAQWPKGLYEGAGELVADVNPSIRMGCFSNTNDIHWSNPFNQSVHDLFDLHFLSHEIGHVKPDASAFQYVIDELKCAPEAIFFVDDNIINVDAARACGFDAHVTKGPDETRQVLSDHGLLKAA